MAMPNVKIGEEFRPEPELKNLFYTYILSAAEIFLLAICLPLILFAPQHVTMIFLLLVGPPILAGFAIVLVWVRKYCSSIVYRLTDHELTWGRGVWFKKTGIVPYNRITNVDIEQGPVSRRYGIATIKIQTAGYSAPTARKAEITIEGMKGFDEIRGTIMEMMKGQNPVAVETYGKTWGRGEAGGEICPKVLEELVNIRKLLEKPRRK